MESAVLAQMHHKNIIKCYHYAESTDRFCMYLEYGGFGSNVLTNQILHKGKAVPFKYLTKWAADILQALEYIHAQRVIHTDIKVDNIIICANKTSTESLLKEGKIAKLIDFGLSHVMKPEDGNKAFMDECVGTPEYQAPEMGPKSWITPAVDIYAFGVLLYEMAMGYKPSKLVGYTNIPKLVQDIKYIPNNWKGKEEVLDLVTKCLQKEPGERITASEALTQPLFLL